jgi:hypothetical protein
MFFFGHYFFGLLEEAVLRNSQITFSLKSGSGNYFLNIKNLTKPYLHT